MITNCKAYCLIRLIREPNMLIETLRVKIIEFMKSGQDTARDILKLVLSETQRLNKNDDETVLVIINKLIEANNLTLEKGGHNIKLVRENEVLKSYLPATISKDELNNHLSAIENELAQKIGGQKIGFARRYLKDNNVNYLMKDLQELLKI